MEFLPRLSGSQCAECDVLKEPQCTGQDERNIDTDFAQRIQSHLPYPITPQPSKCLEKLHGKRRTLYLKRNGWMNERCFVFVFLIHLLLLFFYFLGWVSAERAKYTLMIFFFLERCLGVGAQEDLPQHLS